MGIRLTLCAAFLLFLNSCANLKQKKENIEGYKEIAFCTCINENYSKVNNNFTSQYMDVSKSVVFSGKPLSPDIVQSIEEYTKKITKNVWKDQSHTTSEVGGNANFISLSCLKFYNSKELDDYIKSLIKKN